MKCPRIASFVLLVPVALLGLRTHAEDEGEKVSPKEALGWFNPLVGEWRGVGQLRRGSNVGAWRETGEFVWDFSKKDVPAVRYVVADGKHLESVRVTWDAVASQFVLNADLPGEDATRTYRGVVKDGTLTADSAPDDDDWVHRLVVTRLNQKRTLVRYERRKSTGKFFTRVAEVGHTRSGTSLAVDGAGEPECIVTGGRGTMLVSFKGKSYYVCCEGCRQAFEDDPASVIADYEARLAERREKAGT